MTREEILSLSKMTEEELYNYLWNTKVLSLKTCTECGEYGEAVCVSCNHRLTESLADCAFRLRDEVCKNSSGRYAFYAQLELVLDKCDVSSILTVCVARPIHWITAALLAKENL